MSDNELSNVKEQITAITSKLWTLRKEVGLCDDIAERSKVIEWADGSYEPSPGTIIFFDWEGDGVTDHTGIVQKCENGTVYTVEGNSGDTCRTKTYTVGSSVIYGYGIPAY